MPDITRVIEISFNAVNKTHSAVESVGKDLTKLSNNVTSMAAPFSIATKGVLALDAALAALAIGGIAYSTKQFSSFDDTMRKVSSIIGASDEEIKDLTALTKELGVTTRYTAKEAAEGLEFLAMAGLSASESMKALPEVLNLAQASTYGIGETADVLTNIMSGYGIAVEDLGRTSDILTGGFTSANTNLMELGNAFKYVGPVASGMGVSLEETTAILGKLADAGIKGEAGGTALRNILLALVAPAGNAGKLMKELGVDTEELGIDLASSANALKSLGVNVKDAEGNLKPFPDIMKQLQTGLEDIQSPADQTAILIEIFGKRGGPQLEALLSQGADSVENLSKKLSEIGPITKQIATDMEAGIGGALRSLNSAFEATTLSIGENVERGLVPAINSARDVFRAITFSIQDGAFDPVFDAFEEFGTEVAEVLSEVAENLPEAFEDIDFDDLVDSLFELADTFGGIFSGIDVNDPASLADGMQKVVDTLESIVRFSNQISNIFITLGKHFLTLAEKFNSLDDETIATIAKVAGVATAISALAAPIAIVGTAISGLTGALTILAAHPVVAFFIAASAAVYGIVKGVDWLTEKIIEMGRESDENLSKPAEAAEAAAEAMDGMSSAADGSAQAVEDMAERTKEGFASQIKHMEDTKDGSKELTKELEKLGVLVVKPEVDTESITKAKTEYEELEYTVTEGGKEVTKKIKVEVESKNVDETKKEIEEKIPAAKKMEIETDLQIEKIKAQAGIAETALKLKADVDIAEIEAGARAIEALAQSMSASFESTGSTISSLFSSLSDDDSLSKQNAIMRAISEEQELRKEALSMQQDLNKAQIDYLKAKKDAVDKGEALITVQGDGLTPHLKAMMDELLSYIIVEANQETIDQLLLGAT
jgi:TP901 family phage tail tape measure protein